MPPKGAPRGPDFSGKSLLTGPGSAGRGGGRSPANDRDDDETNCRREAFRQGVHHRNWDKGVRLSDELNFAAELGVPHSDDVYRGRDGRHYQSTPASREDPEILALHLKQEPDTGASAWETIGRAMDKALPQALQIMARDDFRAPPPLAREDRAPVNQNRPPVSPAPAPLRSAQQIARDDRAPVTPTLLQPAPRDDRAPPAPSQSVPRTAREDRTPVTPIPPQPAPNDDFRAPPRNDRAPPASPQPTSRDDFRAPPAPASSQPAPSRPAQRIAREDRAPAGPNIASILPPISPQTRAMLSGMERAAADNDDTRMRGDGYVRLAEADTGNASDAVEPAAKPDLLYNRWPDGGAHNQVTRNTPYPGGSMLPAYRGEAKAMGPLAEGAIAAIPNLIPAAIWPVAGRWSLNERKPGVQGDGRYGNSRIGDDGKPKNHDGIDITAEIGTPVRAVKPGKIVSVVKNISKDGNSGYGNEIIIEHADGTFTQYAHMEPSVDQNGQPLKDKNGKARVSLKVGDSVKAGDQIGTVGITGNVPKDKNGKLKKGVDPHLHFEVRYGYLGLKSTKRTTINPLYLLPQSLRGRF
jgi:murein DD-endopeptidase MepM/ murein hydrolase activator NlpD